VAADASLADDVAFTWAGSLSQGLGGGVAVGDVTGDGRSDLVFVDSDYACGDGAETVRVLAGPVTSRGGPLAGLGDVVLTVPDATWAQGLTVADENGDGNLDIVMHDVSRLDEDLTDVVHGPLTSASTVDERDARRPLQTEAYQAPLGYVAGARVDVFAQAGVSALDGTAPTGRTVLAVADVPATEWDTLGYGACAISARAAWAGTPLNDLGLVGWVGAVDGTPTALVYGGYHPEGVFRFVLTP
jgi:hypothetical protein